MISGQRAFPITFYRDNSGQLLENRQKTTKEGDMTLTSFFALVFIDFLLLIFFLRKQIVIIT